MSDPITLIYALLWLFAGASAVIVGAIIHNALNAR
jgi:hypothetical protein